MMDGGSFGCGGGGGCCDGGSDNDDNDDDMMMMMMMMLMTTTMTPLLRRMMLYFCWYRCHPFEQEAEENGIIAFMLSLTQGARPPPPPDSLIMPPGIQSLMEVMWQDDPAKRPAIETVCSELVKLARAGNDAPRASSLNAEFVMFGNF
jgi:hypothetical protein